MDPAPAPGTPLRSVVFQDGLGERRRINDLTGADTIELLCLRGELTAIPSFEFALRERTSRLSSFRNEYYSHVRSVDRLNDPAATLAVVSDSIKGVRLSNLLAINEKRPGTLDIRAAMHLGRQLVSATATLHEHARDVAHGSIGPERIIVTPNARLVIVEYVLGAALEQLRFSRERYWKELRIALPPSPGLPRFDERADVMQVGVVLLSLILGRLLREDEFPARLTEALASASATSSKGETEPLAPTLRFWLSRALQLESRQSFATAVEARDELDRLLSPGARQAGEAGEQDGENDADDGDTDVDDTGAGDTGAADSDAAGTGAGDTYAAGNESADVHPAPVAERLVPVEIPPVVIEPPVPPPSRITPSPAPAIATPLNSVKGSRRWGRLAAVAVALVAISTAGVLGARRYWIAAARGGQAGTLNINTDPPGAQVVVDGQMRGVTPLKLMLSAGGHVVELMGGSEPRTLPVNITAGTQVSEFVELPKITAAFGQLEIRSEPVGAHVTVDGIPRGKAPVFVEALAPGEHAVAVESETGTVRQSVAIEAGRLASLIVPLTPAEAAPVSGWISVSGAPVELQLFEKGRLIGSSQSERLMVAAGKHEIEMVNENVGYRSVRTVQVLPGKLVPITMEWPKGSISINALPWADVWIDGERVGETPIGNLALPIGPHELLFRHPDLGEQKYAVTVSLKTQARVSVDLRQKP